MSARTPSPFEREIQTRAIQKFGEETASSIIKDCLRAEIPPEFLIDDKHPSFARARQQMADELFDRLKDTYDQEGVLKAQRLGEWDRNLKSYCKSILKAKSSENPLFQLFHDADLVLLREHIERRLSNHFRRCSSGSESLIGYGTTFRNTSDPTPPKEESKITADKRICCTIL